MSKLRSCFAVATIALVIGGGTRVATAWGPHPRITEAALEVVPELNRWKKSLGADNIAALRDYCRMPDARGQDLGTYYADDYLLIRAMPYHVGHVRPDVEKAFVPYYWRALQGFRTETTTNACRQLGPLLHFVEDIGAPPHAKPKCPHHSELENWVRADQITIRGYQPKLLGQTDEEALKGLLARIAGLAEFSKARAERALPLVAAPSPDRSKVEPIILESALETSRVSADFLYTMFTLGLKPQPEGAGLDGTVTAAEFPLRNEHGARIVLLDSDFSTLAVSTPGEHGSAGWRGRYQFHNLPAGTYRVLAYRTGSQASISPPIALQTGKIAKLDFSLSPTVPAGNIVENPDAKLSYLSAGQPDRWQPTRVGKDTLWTSPMIRVAPQASYRCGAILKEAKAQVKFTFIRGKAKKGNATNPTILELPGGDTHPAEVRYTAGEGNSAVTVRVLSDKPLADAIERIWIVPEPKP